MVIVRQKEHLRLNINTDSFNAGQVIEYREAGRKMLSASSNCFLSTLSHFEPSLKNAAAVLMPLLSPV